MALGDMHEVEGATTKFFEEREKKRKETVVIQKNKRNSKDQRSAKENFRDFQRSGTICFQSQTKKNR